MIIRKTDKITEKRLIIALSKGILFIKLVKLSRTIKFNSRINLFYKHSAYNCIKYGCKDLYHLI